MNYWFLAVLVLSAILIFTLVELRNVKSEFQKFKISNPRFVVPKSTIQANRWSSRNPETGVIVSVVAASDYTNLWNRYVTLKLVGKDLKGSVLDLIGLMTSLRRNNPDIIKGNVEHTNKLMSRLDSAITEFDREL